jgi:predicted transcriptional regulator
MTSFRLSDDARKSLAFLAKEYHLSKTAVLEQIIRNAIFKMAKLDEVLNNEHILSYTIQTKEKL